MRDKTKTRLTLNIFLLICIMLMAFPYITHIQAALLDPYTIDNIDFLSEEPFKNWRTIRSSAVLTNSYVDTDELNTKQISKVALLLDITQGSLTSVEYRVFISYDRVNWYLEATETVAAGLITDAPANYTVTLAGDVKYFKIFNMYAPYFKLSIKGTGTVTGSLASVNILGVM